MRKRKVDSRFIFTIIVIGVLLVGLPICFYLFCIPHETHSFWGYAKLRAGWGDLGAHFPEKIPENASFKKFSHFPGFLQGGAHIQLRLRLPSDKIRELYDQFAKVRTQSSLGGNMSRHDREKNLMTTTCFYTNGNDEYSFPPSDEYSFTDDFEIMSFDKILPESQRHPNHGTSHGEAISTHRNEIVYWAESW